MDQGEAVEAEGHVVSSLEQKVALLPNLLGLEIEGQSVVEALPTDAAQH
jgi:hypothetical protein